MNELVNRDLSWQEALESYEEMLVTSGRHAASSIVVRMNLLQRIVLFAKQNKVLLPGQLNKTLIFQYFKTRKLSNSTKVTQKRYLSHFFDFLENQFVISDNYAELLPSPKVYRKERVIPHEEEIEAIYQAILSKNNPSVVARDLAIVDLLINPALRVSELVTLKIGDVFFEEENIKVTRKGGDQQLLPIRTSTAGHLQEMLEYRGEYSLDDHLFLASKKYNGRHHAMGVRGVQKLIRKYLINNVALNKLSYGPHLLRHVGGTMMARNGTDLRTIQKIMNHKQISTTMIYQHTDIEQMRNAVQNGRDFSSK